MKIAIVMSNIARNLNQTQTTKNSFLMTFQFNPGIILTHLHLNSGTFSIASIFSLVIFFLIWYQKILLILTDLHNTYFFMFSNASVRSELCKDKADLWVQLKSLYLFFTILITEARPPVQPPEAANLHV